MNEGARSLERADATPSAPFNAPLFRALIGQLVARERWVVLDLGAAHTQTVALFGQFRCRLDIADVGPGLDALNATTDRHALTELAEAMLPKRQLESTDLVFCWDLLNYLQPAALHALMNCVAARTRPDAVVHALIAYSDTHMPATPGSFVPQGDGSLLNLCEDPKRIPAPRYSPEALCQHMPGYLIDRAMLLGNGMQEFLFRC